MLRRGDSQGRIGVLARIASAVIMRSMSNVRADKLLRVACGLGLLVLLATYENAWPALRRPVEVKQQRAGGKKKTRKPAPPLPCLLPDAAAPRWPATWDEARPHRVTGWHDGIVSCGQRSPAGGGSSGSHTATFDPLAWHRFLEPAAPAELAAAFAALTPPVDPALQTVISRTGPPLG